MFLIFLSAPVQVNIRPRCSTMQPLRPSQCHPQCWWRLAWPPHSVQSPRPGGGRSTRRHRRPRPFAVVSPRILAECCSSAAVAALLPEFINDAGIMENDRTQRFAGTRPRLPKRWRPAGRVRRGRRQRPDESFPFCIVKSY